MRGYDASLQAKQRRAEPDSDDRNAPSTTSLAVTRPLGILLAMEPGGGGVGRHVIDLATGFLQLGHRVDLVYSPRRAEAWLLEALASLPLLRAHPVNLEREVGWRDATSALALQRVMRECGPFDIAHGHSSKAGALLRLVSSRSSARRVYTPHAFVTLSPDLGRLKRTFYGTSERILASFSDAIICVSDEEKQHAISLGIRPGKLFVVNNGIRELAPANRTALRGQFGIEPGDVCVGFVGRLAPQKAVDRLVAAFAAAYARHRNLRLLIIGDGPDLPSLKHQAHALGIEDRVSFGGNVDGADAMSAFDIFVLPSRYEAFPYVYLEATARGLPIITTQVGGSSDVVTQEYNGFIVAQDLHHQMAEKISCLCTNPGLRNEMGKRSEEIAQRFTMDRMVQQTLACYERLLTTA